MGYNSNPTEAQSNLYCIFSFTGVGADENYKLGQIGVGESGFSYWNGDYVATIDQYGAQDKYYAYDLDAESVGHWYVSDVEGNIDYDQVADDVQFPINKGLIVYSEYGDPLTFSGQVISGETELYTSAQENTYTGNFTPATLRLGDLVVDPSTFSYWNGDYLATIDGYGAQDTYYAYDMGADDEYGWFVSDVEGNIDYDQPADAVEFTPNQGFILYTEYECSLSIPSPIK